MHVVATAGHVDHGKSTLVRALTGTDPDRYAEEKRRGLTIDLGFAWTDLAPGRTVAFVDVPGHERFVPTMLAGVGSIGVVLFVVAADGGWMPQSAEHLAALDALGVSRGMLVVTRADLADPGPATQEALAHLARTSLGTVPAVACSATTGQGLDDVRRVLGEVLAQVPPPPAGPVRLWVDRSFSVRGAGTVVTGTLATSSIAVGDELDLAAADGGRRRVRVRGLQSLEHDVPRADAVTRVAVNLRGVERGEVARGDALLTPGSARSTAVVDVRLAGVVAAELPQHVVAHLGTAAVGARVRPLGPDTLRLQLDRPLPLWIGDRLLVREPAQHLVLGGAVVLDVAPPPLRRRGAAAARAQVLAPLDGTPDEASELRRRGLVRAGDLRAMGVEVRSAAVARDWHADPAVWTRAGERLREAVAAYVREHPLHPGPTLEEARHACALPDRALVEALVAAPLRVADGRIVTATDQLPAGVSRAVAALRAGLAADPFAAPDAERLRELGLGRAELAAAVRAGLLSSPAPGIVLGPDALDRAAERLAALPAPFTVSEAKQALGTSRRVAVPLLSALDAARRTRRGADDRRTLVPR
ncbi:selenocysteine-specific translation elongation factor [Kineococcus rubinsiae]|uniref:selenocysteine-specific translation elongation factor n=1 Tax=Kineococcus rubinsiae TaxID=2609562 RepID=UPI00143060F8|nr:selenocysteine-specific translation elongation factor [Kineococcus rubinsiae]NIZ89492.1 selenocysteine-specific translation elongation factor [Kineococcus rubinsiae]